MTMTVLHAIILNWRTPDMTLRSAEALVAAMAGIDGAITIVDNDSGDGSEGAIARGIAERGWDRVRLLQSGRNGGFGAGNNHAIRAGLPDGRRPDFVYLLNSDAFPAPDAVRALLDHMLAHPRTGMAGSYIHGPDGDPHTACFRFPSVASEFEGAAVTGPITRLLHRHVVPRPIPDRPTRMDWVAGASLMMRQDLLDEIGIFDEEFFLYFEETDLCLRAARAGWQTDFVPASRVMHIGSVSTGMKTWARTPDYWFDSRRHYWRKNHGQLRYLAATGAVVAGSMIARLRGRRAAAPGFTRQLLAHMLTGPRPAPESHR
ncbi:hypothetical protein SAMN05444389_11244 [Paracoccus solventivorans]|uniref:Glycosyltransferase 2-like domain-containing protein n=1 Tax=Paracoccus solventivorans TaxID=53463 RepID=A0A1M7JJ33_9RHOB|nr:glycosyltransferase family 2 protein [Paracoccus solventivorans]SHM53072.1 hypothetical protein SAMN05444389_11244 [Paracoccus solventivorans]